jgi:hypothetical protein
LKVCVYAIAKNEEKFAARWAQSMKEADEIFVLDTGSTDETVKILEENGVQVSVQKIEPWRFDKARNASLDLVPEDADICVCTDLDEVFHPGWREKMELQWKKGADRLRYRYTWNFQEDGSEGIVFWIEKTHARKGYQWVNPVHEVLAFEKPSERILTVEGVQLDHHADDTKPRTQYLPLLELAVEEMPDNDRNVHYLGREYMYTGQYQKAIEMLKRHLEMPKAIWRDERCASMRYIAKCYVKLGNIPEAYKYFLLAIGEAPHLREPWLDAAYFEYMRKNWLGAAYFIEYALTIKERPRTYITEASSWDGTPYDVLSIAYYHIGDIDKAIENIRKAIAYSDEVRLKENLKLFESEERQRKT